MKKIFFALLIFFTAFGSFNAQGQVKYALNAFFDYSTPSMSDGKIVFELVGNYPNQVEFHVPNSFLGDTVILDSLCNLPQSFFSGLMAISIVDVITQDTILEIFTFPGIFADLSINWNSIQNPSNDFLCNGSFDADVSDAIIGLDLSWYPNFPGMGTGSSLVPIPDSDSLTAENLCTGYCHIAMSLASGVILFTGVYLQPLNTTSGLIDVEVYSTPSSSVSCTSSATSTVTGGVPPYLYYWDFIAGNSDEDSLCSGLHSLKIVDANSDSTVVLFGVADSNYFYEDTLFTGIPVDTIYFMTEDCGIDYGASIDSIAITFVDFYTSSDVVMGFTIWQGASTFFVQDTATYGPPEYGLFLIDFTQFCLNKSIGGGAIRFNGLFSYFLDMTENSGKSFHLYPNPANQFIQIEGDNIEKISIYNLLGELICTTTNRTIDVSEFPKGMYQVVLLDADDSRLTVKKLIVQ